MLEPGRPGNRRRQPLLSANLAEAQLSRANDEVVVGFQRLTLGRVYPQHRAVRRKANPQKTGATGTRIEEAVECEFPLPVVPFEDA